MSPGDNSPTILGDSSAAATPSLVDMLPRNGGCIIDEEVEGVEAGSVDGRGRGLVRGLCFTGEEIPRALRMLFMEGDMLTGAGRFRRKEEVGGPSRAGEGERG